MKAKFKMDPQELDNNELNDLVKGAKNQFEFVELPNPPPRPTMPKIKVIFNFTKLETVEEFENAVIGINPRHDIVVLRTWLDEQTFIPWKLMFFRPNGLFYAAPLNVIEEAGDENEKES